jgi:hypothetical protein
MLMHVIGGGRIGDAQECILYCILGSIASIAWL